MSFILLMQLTRLVVVTLLDLGYVIKSIDWSPDGKQIVFSTTKPGELYFIDMTTGVGKEWFNSYKERCQN